MSLLRRAGVLLARTEVSQRFAVPNSCGAHTVFGAIVKGMDVVNDIEVRDPATATSPGDAIRSITIDEGMS